MGESGNGLNLFIFERFLRSFLKAAEHLQRRWGKLIHNECLLSAESVLSTPFSQNRVQCKGVIYLIFPNLLKEVAHVIEKSLGHGVALSVLQFRQFREQLPLLRGQTGGGLHVNVEDLIAMAVGP